VYIRPEIYLINGANGAGVRLMELVNA